MLLIADLHNTVVSTLTTSTGGRRGCSWTPWGYRPTQHASQGLHGQRYEPGRYLLGNGHRAYLPTALRFASPDKWSPFGRGGLNAYAFCTADPVNLVDPSGRFPLVMKAAMKFASKRARPPSLDRIIETGRTIASHLDPHSVIALSETSPAWRYAIGIESAAAKRAILLSRAEEYARHAAEYVPTYVSGRLLYGAAPLEHILGDFPYPLRRMPVSAKRFLDDIDVRFPYSSVGPEHYRWHIVHEILSEKFPISQSDLALAGYIVPRTESHDAVIQSIRTEVSQPDFWLERLPR
jgi:RHS repeat-associated protein